MSRVGNWLLCAGGLVLAALMVYMLAMDTPGLPTWPAWGRPSGVAEVAVFFPNQADWGDFRRGIAGVPGPRPGASGRGHRRRDGPGDPAAEAAHPVRAP